GFISAAKIVADRIKTLRGLEAIIFDKDMKARLKERSQLHHMIADNAWMFGEEYHLAVSDRSLTEVLRAHKKGLDDSIVIDEIRPDGGFQKHCRGSGDRSS
ncbi:MAG: hypothetical protein O7I42_22565, partial [Alphaproteobacteria bacterium]|nr:hypothetical protein [Alphaproteobacteria bacterium]